MRETTKKRGKGRIHAVLMAAVILFVSVVSCISDIPMVRAAEELVLKLHYNREDGNYDGWDVWIWEIGGEGNGYAFAEENGEMVATKIVPPGITSMGFIVRTADWAKDVDKDQFIDVAEMVSGTVHIYVESGVEGFTKEYGDDAVIGIKLSKARYNEETHAVTALMTGPVESDPQSAFRIKGADGEVAITEAAETKEDDQIGYVLTLAEPLDLNKEYSITFDGNEYKVVMPNIYSTEDFEKEFTYTGDDLGATWSKDKTVFRVWAPTAESMAVNLYAGGTAGEDDLQEQLQMEKDVNGTWVAEKEGDLNGTYYTYTVRVRGEEKEACDPYARTTGVNGKRAMSLTLLLQTRRDGTVMQTRTQGSPTMMLSSMSCMCGICPQMRVQASKM